MARSAPPGPKTHAIRHDIMEGILPENLEGAAGLPEPLADLGHFLLETAVDPSSEFSDAPCAEVDDWKRPWVHVADDGAESVAELVFDTGTESDYSVPERLTAAFEQALGIDGLGALEARFRASLENEPRLTHGEDRDRQWNQRMLLHDLEAELRGYGGTLAADRSEFAVQRIAQLKKGHHIARSQ